MSSSGSPAPGYNVMLAALTAAGFAFALQLMLLAPALQVIAGDLHTTTAWANWIVTIFLLTSSVATPLLGRLGDKFGKKRLLLVTLIGLLLGSVLAIFAWNIWSLIAFRALQGTGGAVLPLGFAIIRDEFPPKRIGVAIGVQASVFGLAGPLGIVLSGVLLEHASWRWLFVIGATVIAVAIFLVHRLVPESPVRTPGRLDLRGAALFSGGLICLLLVLTEGNERGWSSSPIIVLSLASILLFLSWARLALRLTDPMIDLRLLARRDVLLTNASTLLTGASVFGLFLLVPVFVQTPNGFLPAEAGLSDYGFAASPAEVAFYLGPLTLIQVVIAPGAGLLSRRRGPKLPFVLGCVALACGSAMLAVWHERPWQVSLGMLVAGVGVGATTATSPHLIVDAVKQTETGVAIGVNYITRYIGGVVGGQLGIALIAARTIGSSSVPAEGGYVVAFWLFGAVALVSTLLAAMLGPTAARHQRPATTSG